MKFQLVTLSTLLVGAFATLDDAKAAISVLSAGVTDLAAAIHTAATPADIKALESRVTGLSAEFQNAQKAFQGLGTLTLADINALTPSILPLVTLSSGMLSDITNKAPLFKEAGDAPVILKTLKDEKAAYGSLSDQVIAKLPTATQGLAKSTLSNIQTLVDAAINAYSK